MFQSLTKIHPMKATIHLKSHTRFFKGKKKLSVLFQLFINQQTTTLSKKVCITVFSCEFCKIFLSNLFSEYLQVIASEEINKIVMTTLISLISLLLTLDIVLFPPCLTLNVYLILTSALVASRPLWTYLGQNQVLFLARKVVLEAC